MKKTTNEQWLDIARQAYEVGTKEARRVEGCGFLQPWEQIIPASQAGYVALVKWVMKLKK